MQQQQRPMNGGEVQRGGNNYKVPPNPMTVQRVIVQKQNQGVHRLVQRPNSSVPQQREITVREVFTPQNGWKPSFNRPGTQVQQAARVSRVSLPAPTGVMYVERSNNQSSSSRPVNLHVTPTPNQRNILRQQQLIQHAQPQNNQLIRNGAAQYQKVTIEPPRVQQFQQPQQQRQVKSPNSQMNQQRPVSNQITRIQTKTPFSRKRSAPTPPTPESVENFAYSPSGTAPSSKRAKESTGWQQSSGMTDQQPTVQPTVNEDGSLPDYVRHIAGFEIRVIRSKDPDMRLFPC
ncbi:unnamed protein product [Caenorhabditis brenneri]